MLTNGIKRAVCWRRQYIGVILSKSQSRYSADAVVIPDTSHLPFDFFKEYFKGKLHHWDQFHLIVNSLK